MPRHATALVAVLAGALLLPGGLAAQDTTTVRRIATVLEHIAGTSLYVPAGTAAGLQAGDTLHVYDARDGRHLGVLVVIGATDRRASLSFAGRPFPLTRGMALLLEPLAGGAAGAVPDAARAAALRAIPAAAPATTPAAPPPIDPARRPTTPPLRLHGSIAADLDAYRTSSSWDGPGSPGLQRTLIQPVGRLHATLTGLPLGVRLSANVRAAYRSGGRLPERSFRVYQATIERDFDRLPLQLRLGRFRNAYSSFGAYWDGASARIGGEALGIGAAWGYAPARGNEGFSSDIVRRGAFVDYRYRGSVLSYTTDVAVLDERAAAAGWSSRTFGWSQRLRWRGVFLGQRLELDLDPPGTGERVRSAFLDASVPLAGGFRVEGGYAFDQPRLYDWGGLPLASLRAERVTTGVSWSGRLATLSAGAGRIRTGDRPAATSLDGSLYLPRGPFALGLGLAVSHWSGAGTRTLFLSPSLDRSIGAIDARASYHLYSAREGVTVSRLHGSDVSLAFPLRGGVQAQIGARGQWGGGLSTVRLWSGIRAGF